MKSTLQMDFSVDKENKKINVEREFAAPLTKVWRAWTDKDLLDKWWAPKPWQTRTKTMDFREGGHWIYAMEGPDGSKHWARADYKKIEPQKKFTGLDAFCDEEGNVNDKLPRSLWSVRFNENAGTTRVSVEISYDSLSDLEKNIEMGFKEGFTSALGNLDELLSK